jgi:tetratricopeptide (TPR) repeat protein
MRTTGLILWRSLIFGLFLFLVVSKASAQGANVLTGKVIAPNGSQPTSPVRVKLTFNGRPIHETFSDLSGRFAFPGLTRGTYQLTAVGDGMTFETTSVTVDVSAFGSAGQTFSQDIPLRPIAGKTTTQPGVINAFTQNVPVDAKESLEQGLKLIDAGKGDEAIEKFQHALRIFPKYFEAHLQLGNLFLKSGRPADAIAELDLAREINPNDERTYQSFGLLLMGQKNYGMAVAIFAEAGRLNPQNPMNALMRGIALIHHAASIDPAHKTERSSLLKRADEALNQALSQSENKMKPDSPTLALFYEMRGEPERAATELESYLRKAPQTRNSEALKNEIKRLREKAQVKPQP